MVYGMQLILKNCFFHGLPLSRLKWYFWSDYWWCFNFGRYVSDSVESRFPSHDKNQDGKVSFEEYKETTYGEIEGSFTVHWYQLDT